MYVWFNLLSYFKELCNVQEHKYSYFTNNHSLKGGIRKDLER